MMGEERAQRGEEAEEGAQIAPDATQSAEDQARGEEVAETAPILQEGAQIASDPAQMGEGQAHSGEEGAQIAPDAAQTGEAPTGPLFSNPPGGFFIWFLVVLELGTFGIGLAAFGFSARGDLEGYGAGSQQLNATYGLINTIFLLTSGWLMAESVRHHQLKNFALARRTVLGAAVGGLLFMGLKGWEYAEKFQADQFLGSSPFFTWYWLLTGFHVMHVLVGLVILWLLAARAERIAPDSYEAGGVYWHMCDIIWLLLYPVLYLIL